MRRNLIWAGVIALSVMTTSYVQADIVFTFDNGSSLDGNEPAGASLTATDGVETVTLTTVGVFAPEFDEPSPDVFVLTGNTIAAGTSLNNSDNLGINNPSISNGDFIAATGLPGGTEGNDFNLGEILVLEFDTDVTIDEINFASIDDDGGITLTVQGIATPFVFADGTSGDDFADPLGGIVIAAGTDLTFEVFAEPNAASNPSVRIDEITVTVVSSIPEPSSVALLSLMGIGMIARRRK